MPLLSRYVVSFTLLLASCLFNTVVAQVYPVQVTPQLIPPYSVYLSDYATDGNEKLRVIVLQRDLSRPSYPIRLSMTVELNNRVILRTTRAFNPSAIYVNPGIPVAISGAELAPYLDSRNLDFIGIDRAQYERTRALPEGQYRIAFTAYDYYRPDVPISAEGNSFYYLTKSEPPMVNFPACGMKIALKTPQQIVFSWMPRNTASPNSALDTEYEFSLYETRPAGRNPNDVVLTTQPVFKTRVEQTQLIYGPAEPLLLAEMNYVWRVQAIDRTGRDAFRNNGFSEVCSFYYGGPDVSFEVGTVNDLRALPETKNRAKIWWTPGMYDGYRVEYRKTGDATFEWFRSETTTGEVKLFDLEPDTEYEARLQAKKSGFYGPYSDIIKFRMLPERAVECGQPAKLPDINNPGPPLTAAHAGMVVDARGVEMTLIAVTALEIPGWYKGVGRVTLDYFLGLSYGAIFNRIYINENREVILGRIDIMSKSYGGLLEKQLAEVKKQEEEKKKKENETKEEDKKEEITPIVFPGVIDSVRVNAEGKVVVTDDAGKEVIVPDIKLSLDSHPEKTVVIQDASGTKYEVQKDPATGQTKVTKVESSGGVPPGGNANTTVQADPVKDRIIVLILEQFEEEIAAWLRINGKGGEDDPDVLRAEELASCFNKDVGQLTYIKEKTIPYFKAHPAELREKIEADQTKKIVLDKIAASFKSKEDVAWSKVNADDQKASRDYTCKALMDDIAPLISFYEKAKPLLEKDEYTGAIQKIRAIYQFFKTCNNEGWTSYNDEGIIPYCFWRDQNISSVLHYTSADLPFSSGLIDGAYIEAEGLYHLPEVVKDVSKFPSKLVYAYTLAYWQCSPEKLIASVEEYEYVIEQLATMEEEGGLWNWVKEQVYEYEEKKEDIEKYFKDCRDAEDLRATIDDLYELVTNWEEIKTLSQQVYARLGDYWKTLSSTGNINRYQQGRVIIPAATLILPFGAGIASKAEKLKNGLKLLREASAENWKRFTDELGELIAKRTITIPSGLVSKLTQQGSTKLKSWLSSKSLSYADNTGAKFSGTAAETKIFDDLDATIGNKQVVETLEDTQGRFSMVLERPGQTNQVISIHPTSAGDFKITTFDPAYNPNLNSNIPAPVSVNRLVPDYAGTQYLHSMNQGKVIRIEMSGNRATDFIRANVEIGLSSKPANYTWHHLDDFEVINGKAYCTMQLVQSSVHGGLGISGMAHTGSVAQWKAYFSSGY
jgi:A nuclease of the HNH/ENDO VII superfamily with conserved WHH/Fibronectin type III domain